MNRLAAFSDLNTSPLQSLLLSHLLITTSKKSFMDKRIAVKFHSDGRETPIVITYNILMEENIQVINCSIESSEDKNLLQLNKFELKSQYSEGKYVALFNETIQKKNIDTSLFVDEVYIAIMAKEKMPVSPEYA